MVEQQIVDPDQTPLIWVYALYTSLSVRKVRVNIVYQKLRQSHENALLFCDNMAKYKILLN